LSKIFTKNSFKSKLKIHKKIGNHKGMNEWWWVVSVP
jgi:hypothetical protein